MKDRDDRILWTVIAVFLGIIALNPWIAPGYLWAGSVMDVNIAEINGNSVSPRLREKYPTALPVEIIGNRR